MQSLPSETCIQLPSTHGLPQPICANTDPDGAGRMANTLGRFLVQKRRKPYGHHKHARIDSERLHVPDCCLKAAWPHGARRARRASDSAGVKEVEMVATGKSTDLAAAGRDLEAAQGRKVFVDHLEISRKAKWCGRCAHPYTIRPTLERSDARNTIHVINPSPLCPALCIEGLLVSCLSSSLVVQVSSSRPTRHVQPVLSGIIAQAAAPWLLGRRAGDVLVHRSPVQRVCGGLQGGVLAHACILLPHPPH